MLDAIGQDWAELIESSAFGQRIGVVEAIGDFSSPAAISFGSIIVIRPNSYSYMSPAGRSRHLALLLLLLPSGNRCN